MTAVVDELKRKIAKIEKDGSQVIGIHLTAKLTKEIRWELTQMYGSDPGPNLQLLFGAEVLSQDADELKLIT